ncbi:MAG TPA: phosphatase PAP2 family protein [Bacteroidia bacterium]|nr:phosphatase PAP2 family protein [Bacteroidia bacterium]
MKDIFKSNRSFLIPYLIFLCVGLILIAANTKASTHLEFNSFHSNFFDFFFRYATNLGNGYMVVLVGIILLTVNFRSTLLVALGSIISGLITQLLKHTLFSDVVRPKKFFEGVHDLYLVPGVDNHLYNSFPSGHTTCAFSLYFALALLVKNKMLKFVFFLIALLAGYSRIYLSQHFFEDVYVGSLIGVTITGLLFYYLSTIPKAGLDNSLITVLKKQ